VVEPWKAHTSDSSHDQLIEDRQFVQSLVVLDHTTIVGFQFGLSLARQEK